MIIERKERVCVCACVRASVCTDRSSHPTYDHISMKGGTGKFVHVKIYVKEWP